MRRSFRQLPLLAALALGACNDDGVQQSTDPAKNLDAGPADGPTPGSDATPTDARRPPVDAKLGGPCEVGARACGDLQHELVCETVGGEPRWTEQACPALSYCLGDRCRPGCLDECAHGDRRDTTGGSQSCALYSAAEQDFVDIGDGTRDRARLHEAWLRRRNLVNGYVADVLFTDLSYQTPESYHGTVDSAEWTGTYLAAEALHMRASPSPDAQRNLQQIVERLHQLYEVTGQPGSMARFWTPLGVDPAADRIYEPETPGHHTNTYQGQQVFWHGTTSRDMYQGVMLGYALAYDVLTSETHREMIRQDVIGLASELIKDRKKVPVKVRFKLGGWQEMKLEMNVQYVVLIPDEMEDGHVFILVGSDEDSSAYEDSDLRGAREFIPEWSTVLRQVPLLGALIPRIPRSGSAIMLANILRLALHATAGVPAYATQRAAIEAHYNAQRGYLLDVMREYVFVNADRCFDRYYGLTIVFHPIYSLIHLERDPATKAALQRDVLAGKMWPYVKDHKNVYFSYITAAQAPGTVSAAEISATTQQLTQFPPPPKARILVDNTGKAQYPPDPDCPGQSTVAMDVGDRVRHDFIWQRIPFELKSDYVHPRVVYPGVDYLVAYWMGRHHGYIADDAPDTCLRWKDD